MMKATYKSLLLITLPLTTLGCLTFLGTATAQITPDTSLGAESSVVTPNVEIRDIPSDRIDGGAVRGNNLFHSFSDFNINSGRGAYFSNPSGIANILSRVTGSNASKIGGTLGVLGNANLFFANPNGVIFGPNARLDVSGSFSASTADSFIFDNGFEFSASNPQAPPLLTVNIPVGLRFRENPGSITNTGTLTAGQDLTLAGGNLDLQGQVYAGRDLKLQAQDTVKIRDKVTNPFIAAAGNQLVIQGNQGVDIFALNHNNSGFFSGGDMVLRSANPVGADAHFWTGGDFRIENLYGNGGDFLSFYDPIIRANGNVRFDTYTGASLHIFAGGSVNLGSVTINGTDTSDFINETVTLSDGVTTVAVNGSSQPTLDVRAGTTAIGSPVGLTGSPIPTGLSFVASTTPTADINIGSVSITQPDGLVLLTNQYQPNGATSGVIQVGSIRTDDNQGTVFSGNGGDIFIDSRGDINIPASGQIRTLSATGDAGDIYLIANQTISLANSASIQVGTNGAGRGGNINIRGRTLSLRDRAAITTNTFGSGRGGDFNITTSESVQLTGTSFLQAATGGAGDAGNLTLNTRQLILQNGSQLVTGTFGTGLGGNLTVQALDSANFSGASADGNLPSGLFAETHGAGDAGDLIVETRKLTVRDGAQVSTRTFSSGNAGNLTVVASDRVEVIRTPVDAGFSTGLFTSTLGIGNAGNLKIETARLTVRDGAQIVSGGARNSEGNAGNLTVEDSESVELVGVDGERETGLFSGNDGQGDSGELKIDTRKLVIRNGAVATSANNAAEGQAANLTVNASESVELIGTKIDEEGDYISSGLFTGTRGSKPGGDLNITTKRLVLRDGGQTSAGTLGSGRGGDLTVNASEFVEITGSSPDGRFASWLRTRSDDDARGNRATGDGGNLTINTQRLILRDGGQLSVSTVADGNAGNLTVNASESVEITGDASVASPSAPERITSGIFAQVLPEATGNGGNIEVNTRSLSVKDGGAISTNTSAQGNAGTVTINATNSISLDGVGRDGNPSGVFSSTSADSVGNGGKIDIKTPLLSVNNAAGIGVNSKGTGQAGNIQLQADSFTLDNKAFVSGETASTQGGNINIYLTKFLLMRNNNRISATAGTAGAGGDGGNITIKAKNGFLVALPKKNNDITANAFNGNGGRVKITAQGIFGFVPRSRVDLARLLDTNDPRELDPRRLPTNDITAISQNNPDVTSQGEVNIDTIQEFQAPEVPEVTVIDPRQLIAQNPCKQWVGSEFVVTGRGGLPLSPTQTTRSETVQVDLVKPAPQPNRGNSQKDRIRSNREEKQSTSSSPGTKQIVPAQGWVFKHNGEVVLTAHNSNNTVTLRSRRTPGICSGR